MIDSIDELSDRLRQELYVCDRETATAIFLSIRLKKPLLLEGLPGSGKSALARCLARALGSPLVVLTCHADIDEQQAVYEWNVARQLLRIRLAEANREPFERVERELKTREYLVARPLLEAFSASDGRTPVLLVDRIDRAKLAFEEFLAEALSTFSLSIPGHGVVRAKEPPVVVVTSSGSRELGGRLKGICLYRNFEYPDFAQEFDILLVRVPGISRSLAGQVCNLTALLRERALVRPPRVAETVAWAQALVALRRTELEPEVVDQTLGCVLKDANDIARFRRQPLDKLLRPAVDRVG